MKTFLLVVLVLIGVLKSYSQNKDSISSERSARLLRQMDSTHRADSVRRVLLLFEIEALRGGRKRESLVEKLRIIEKEDSLKKVEQRQRLEKLKSIAVGYAVAPFYDTLFLVFIKVGSFEASDRAQAISKRIISLYGNYDFRIDSLTVIDTGTNSEIMFRDQVIMSINELDAIWFSKKRRSLALEYRDKIRMEIARERNDRSLYNIGIRIATIILILVGIFIFIKIINVAFKRLEVKLRSLKGRALKGLRFRSYQLLDNARQLQVILFTTNILRLAVIVLLLFISLPLLFSVFPWTRGIADTLIHWISSPLKKVADAFVNYIPNLFTILVIGVMTHYFIKFLSFIANEIAGGKLRIENFYPDWAKPTLNIIKFLIYAFSFIIIFPYLPGSQSPIFQGVSVFVGVLFSLGSSSAIANAVAGLVITYMRPFKIGDRVKIGEITGDVIEKSILVTRVRTIKNEEITIPNSAILSGHTINYTTSASALGLVLYTSVTIGYDVPWKQVHELLIKAALSTEGILQAADKKPFVLQTSLDDFYVAYQLNAFTDHPGNMAIIYSGLHQNIQDKFNEAGVEIMSPHYRAARDGNSTAIPSNYLPDDYVAPAFNVNARKDAAD
ncbi:mechanosensitive ion channel [soil metagenome]